MISYFVEGMPIIQNKSNLHAQLFKFLINRRGIETTNKLPILCYITLQTQSSTTVDKETNYAIYKQAGSCVFSFHHMYQLGHDFNFTMKQATSKKHQERLTKSQNNAESLVYIELCNQMHTEIHNGFKSKQRIKHYRVQYTYFRLLSVQGHYLALQKQIEVRHSADREINLNTGSAWIWAQLTT